MSNELAWIETWCSENIEAGTPQNELMASFLAQRARLAAEAAGLHLRNGFAAVGYATLEDYMLDYLAGRADAELQTRDNSQHHRTDYGRRAHQPDPEAKYGFTSNRKGRAIEPSSTY